MSRLRSLVSTGLAYQRATFFERRDLAARRRVAYLSQSGAENAPMRRAARRGGRAADGAAATVVPEERVEEGETLAMEGTVVVGETVVLGETLVLGETETGVTSFFIDDKIDTGAMLLHAKTAINPQESAGTLHDRLMQLGAQTVIETLQLIQQGNPVTQLQADQPDLKTAYKLNKENCKIDWNQPAKSIHDLIRGLSPYPAAWCNLINNEQESAIKVYEATYELVTHQNPIGQLEVHKKELKVAVADGFVHLLQIQLPGKNKMKVADLLNGFVFSEKASLY